MERFVALLTTIVFTIILTSSSQGQTLADTNGQFVSMPVQMATTMDYVSVPQSCCEYSSTLASPVYMAPTSVNYVQPGNYAFAVSEEETPYLLFCGGEWVIKFCPMGQIAQCNAGAAECTILLMSSRGK